MLPRACARALCRPGLRAGTVPGAPVPSTVCTGAPGTFVVVRNCQPHHSSTSATSGLASDARSFPSNFCFFPVSVPENVLIESQTCRTGSRGCDSLSLPVCHSRSGGTGLPCDLSALMSVDFLLVLWVGVTMPELLTCWTRNRKSPRFFRSQHAFRGTASEPRMMLRTPPGGPLPSPPSTSVFPTSRTSS